MKILEFTSEEIQLINESLKLRESVHISDNKTSKDHIEQLSQIRLKVDTVTLGMSLLERNILTGCIRDYALQPNLDLIHTPDSDLLRITDKEKINRIVKIDLAFQVLNKLKKRGEKPYKSYKFFIEKNECLI